MSDSDSDSNSSCPNCGKYTAEFITCQHCEESTCKTCSEICKECGNLICTNEDLEECKLCLNKSRCFMVCTCKTHACFRCCDIHCKTCKSDICVKCLLQCDKCNNNFCKECMNTCEVNKTNLCERCVATCELCEKVAFNRMECPSCSFYLCENCVYKCEKCEVVFSCKRCTTDTMAVCLCDSL